MVCVLCPFFAKGKNLTYARDVNYILASFNALKFQRRNSDVVKRTVNPDVWWAYLTGIREYFKAKDHYVTEAQLHFHATECTTYSAVFISPEVPPVLKQVKTSEPWLTAAYIIF